MRKEVGVDGRISWSIRSAGRIYTYSEDSTMSVEDVWSDISHLHQRDPERTGYATQKPEALLDRIIQVSSEEHDLVLDCFCGSGVTPVVAEKLGRRWIACDQSPLAITTTRDRLLMGQLLQPFALQYVEKTGKILLIFHRRTDKEEKRHTIKTPDRQAGTNKRQARRETMLELLEQLFRQVRSYAQSERYDRQQVYQESPRHTTMQFDRDAEDMIINGLVESGIGFEVTTEERPTFSTAPDPQYRIVIDPIDGSQNMSRGLMTAAIALAVLPIDAPVLPENVQWASGGRTLQRCSLSGSPGQWSVSQWTPLPGKLCQTYERQPDWPQSGWQ